MRRFKTEPFTRAVVEFFGNLVAFVLGEMLEARSLGQVLTNEAIGVFVGSAFPGVIRGSEIEFDTGVVLDVLITMELGAVVEGDGFEVVTEAGDGTSHSAIGLLDVSSGELFDNDKA